MYRHHFPGNRHLSFPERLVFARIGELAAFRDRKKHSLAPIGGFENTRIDLYYLGTLNFAVTGLTSQSPDPPHFTVPSYPTNVPMRPIPLPVTGILIPMNFPKIKPGFPQDRRPAFC
jgi:hypothetical protein